MDKFNSKEKRGRKGRNARVVSEVHDGVIISVLQVEGVSQGVFVFGVAERVQNLLVVNFLEVKMADRHAAVTQKLDDA